MEAHLESSYTRCLSISSSDCPIVYALAFQVSHFVRKLIFGSGMLKIVDVLFESPEKRQLNTWHETMTRSHNNIVKKLSLGVCDLDIDIDVEWVT